MIALSPSQTLKQFVETRPLPLSDEALSLWAFVDERTDGESGVKHDSKEVSRSNSVSWYVFSFRGVSALQAAASISHSATDSHKSFSFSLVVPSGEISWDSAGCSNFDCVRACHVAHVCRPTVPGSELQLVECDEACGHLVAAAPGK